MKLVIYIFALVFAANVFAVGKSAKKIEADVNRLHAPQVVEPTDNMIGFRAIQGDAFERVPMVGANYEHMLTQNFGIGTSLNYAQYATTLHVAGYSGTWEYRAVAFTGYGAFHFDMFHAKNLDTSVSFGVGRTQIKSTWTSRQGLPETGDADASTNYLMGAFNARYFINSEWAFTGSAGAPLGAFSVALGMDYLF